MTLPSFLHDLPTARAALDWAAELHAGQRRESDGAQFIVHPLEVAALLHNTGFPEDVVVAGILHDTVEDTPATVSLIQARFGERVAATVRALSEDPAIPSFADRKAALRRQVAAYGRHATAIYAADKVAKVRELRATASREQDVLAPGDEASRTRLEHYRASLQMLEGVDASHPLVRQLRFELELLSAFPPRSAGATSGGPLP